MYPQGHSSVGILELLLPSQGGLDRQEEGPELCLEALARNHVADLLTGNRLESFPLGFMKVVMSDVFAVFSLLILITTVYYCLHFIGRRPMRWDEVT